jgi:2-polyprenyl-3-methyl-5-hydroxy-6-metoxy-1,4-benzoquinol methylase
MKNLLVSKEYQAVIRREHEISKWGMIGVLYKDLIIKKCEELNVSNFLDYGCGQGLLSKALEPMISVTNYDPGIEQCSTLPVPHDLIVCIDVLEHVEIECLHNVLQHIAELCKKQAIIKVETQIAKRILTDGRNAHLIVKDINWWAEQINLFFKIIEEPAGDMFVVTPLP